MCNEDFNDYFKVALLGRIFERILKNQEQLIKCLRNTPDDTHRIEIFETIILELKSLIK